MQYKRSACLGLLLMLIFCKEQVRAKPMSSLQSLSRLLEDNFDRPYGSDESDHGELVPTDSLDQLNPDNRWNKNRVDPMEGSHINEITLQQLLSDPAGASRRFQQRSKKGFSRGCFGVKLDRIGALSGLGC
ncbi:C-type natriuretic peptide 1-like [Bufo gargarizans]|uniref:C-type natriuretic peptide 1-like n=1 Tax=Bufo gargarizans TaxID=30331 RepID=UPI001CF431F4|nr:C-type natriuretic peptide 1-like [Bufo gargarizans]